MKLLIYPLLAVCIISCKKDDVPDTNIQPTTPVDSVDSVKSMYPTNEFFSGNQHFYSDYEKPGGYSIFDTNYHSRVYVAYPDSNTLRIYYSYIDQIPGSPGRRSLDLTESFTKNKSGIYKDDPKYTTTTFSFIGDSLIIKYYFASGSSGGSLGEFHGVKER